MSELEKRIRAVAVMEARNGLEPAFRELDTSFRQKRVVRRTTFYNALFYAAKLILTKIEEKGDYTVDLWDSYLCLFMDYIYSYGTRDMPVLVKRLEDITKAVISFPAHPSGMLTDHQNCMAAQRTRFQLGSLKQMCEAEARADGPKSSQEQQQPQPPPAEVRLQAPQPPDLEHDGPICAVVPTITSGDLYQILNELPTRMTFAHTSGVLHMKLTNPLAVPAALYAASGYGCDTCKLPGIHVAYQAMLYDSDTPDAGGESGSSLTNTHPLSQCHSAPSPAGTEVRSEAQITKKSFVGFDMCTACAVYFFHKQKTNVYNCLRPPNSPFALGHASGVEILNATYCVPSGRQPPICRRGSFDGSHVGGSSNCASSMSTGPYVSEAPLPPGCGGRSEPTLPALSTGAGVGYLHCTSPQRVRAGEVVDSSGADHRISLDHPRIATTTTTTITPAPPPPAHPPYWHLHCAASHGEDGAHSARCRRRSSGSSISSATSAETAPQPPRTRVPRDDASSSTFASPGSHSLSLGAADGFSAAGTSSRGGGRNGRSLRLTVTVAPYGARPIAWVLPVPAAVEPVHAPDRGKPLSAVCYPIELLAPPPGWQTRCEMHSELAYTHRKEAAAARTKATLAERGKNAGGAGTSSSSSDKAAIVTVVKCRPARFMGSRPTVNHPSVEEESLEKPSTLSATARPRTQPISNNSSAFSLKRQESDAATSGEAANATADSHCESSLASSLTPSIPEVAIDSVKDVCPICLNGLDGAVPVIETTCHHFFHVRCIEPHTRIIKDNCPLCRHPRALPDMGRATALKHNVYRITIRLTEEEAARESVTVCIGALITGSGLFEDITSIAAARCVTLPRAPSRQPTPPPQAHLQSTTPEPLKLPEGTTDDFAAPTSETRSTPAMPAVSKEAASQPSKERVVKKDPRMKAVHEAVANSREVGRTSSTESKGSFKTSLNADGASSDTPSIDSREASQSL